jgi:hypothetical protein
MIWEEYENKDRKKAARVAIVGGCILLPLIFLVASLINYKVTPMKIVQAIDRTLLETFFSKKEKPIIIDRTEVKQPVRKTAPRIMTKLRQPFSSNLTPKSLSAPSFSMPALERRSPGVKPNDDFGAKHRIPSGSSGPTPGVGRNTAPELGEASGPGKGSLGDLGTRDGGGNLRRIGGGGGPPGPKPGGGGGVPNLIPGGGQKEQGVAIPKIKATPHPAQVQINPIIAWMKQNQKVIPVVLRRPENLNQLPQDVTTWVTFEYEDGNKYTLYLVGRESNPAQLNIFLRCGGIGTLLQDMGAKGSSESLKSGIVNGPDENPTVQLQLLPAGDVRAKRMMNVFQSWWAQTSKSSK